MKRTPLVLALFALASCIKGAGDYNKGVEAFKRKDYEEAKRLFEKAIAANPEFTEAHYNLGSTKIRLAKKRLTDGKKDEALSLFKSGMEDKKKAKALADRNKFAGSDKSEHEKMKKDLAEIPEIKEDAAILLALELFKDE